MTAAVAVKRRAIRANAFILVAHVDKDMRMIEGRIGADAHEFLHADFNRLVSAGVLEMGNG